MSNAIYECDCCHGDGEIKYDVNKRIDCADCFGTGYVTIDKLNTISRAREGKEFPGPICGILLLARSNHERGMRGSVPFKIGDKFTTLGGVQVECIQLSEANRGYECARFSDGGWRYNRDHDRGRATGSRWDDRKNILPNFYQEEILEKDMIEAMQQLDVHDLYEQVFPGNQQ